MSLVALSKEELAIIRRHDLKPIYRTGRTNVFSEREIQKIAAKEDAVTRQSDAEYYTSPEFRAEVIAELMANGATELQATNRTRDQFRLFNEARELGLM
jgi:hypothetical protein